MAKQLDNQPTELTDYDFCEMRKVAYAQYLAFVEQRKQQRAAFEEAQKHRGALSKWWHAKLQAIREKWDDDEEIDLLNDIHPYAGYAKYKQKLRDLNGFVRGS